MMICRHRLPCRTQRHGLIHVDIYTTKNSLLSLVKLGNKETILCFTYVDEFGQTFEEFKYNGYSLGIARMFRERVKALILTRTKVS